MKFNEESDSPESDFFNEQVELCQQYIIDTLQLEESEEFLSTKIKYGRIPKKSRRLWQL